MRTHPHVYEVNSLIFLRRASKKYGRDLTLMTIPDEEWLRLVSQGFDYVWLMGVWQRSEASRRAAIEHGGLRKEYSEAFPDWTDEDIVGSPYAVYDYSLDSMLGQPDDLRMLKAKLNSLGLGVILDFVPNHAALDHPWILEHPEWFIQGTEQALKLHPDWFFSSDGVNKLAYGKDPYFPPWTDTAQLNYCSMDMRERLTQELLKIAEVSDGLRCDMAMLPLNSVFQPVWDWAIKGHAKPTGEFWPDAINRVRARYPEFLFMAEVYWGLERELQHMGFDFTYDKPLYDKLRTSDSSAIREHLMASAPYQSRQVRFIENHDEARAASAFSRERARAAALVLATSPGLRMFHDGQFEGKRARLPVQLGREPDEAPDVDIGKFYDRALSISNSEVFHEGKWTELDAFVAWDGNESNRNVLAWTWKLCDEIKVIAINYSSEPTQARVHMSLPVANGGCLLLRDELAGVTYDRDYDELKNFGLYISLEPWGAHVFDVKLAS